MASGPANSTSVLDRLRSDPSADLRQMLEHCRTRGIPSFMTTLRPAFDAARGRPEMFRNLDPVLAISIGGSNVKVMLAHLDGGVVVVHRIIARANPTSPTDFDDYFDGLLMDEPLFADYLRGRGDRRIGLSIPVGIVDGVPVHATKIPFVTRLVARDLARDRQTHHLRRNLETYFHARGIAPPPVAYEGDCPLAHLGSVVMARLGREQPSLLSICGTGMASADDERFILLGNVPVLARYDAELFPPDQTENCQLQYCIAGKGLWGVMRRAILLRATEAGSRVPARAADFFQSPADSRTVGELWETTRGDGAISPRTAEIRSALGDAAFGELAEIAAAAMERAISAFVNNTLATQILLSESADGRPLTIFTEGSIARNPAIYPIFRERFLGLSADRALFTSLGAKMPPSPRLVDEVRRLHPATGCPAEALQDVDITIVGAMCLGAIDTLSSRL